jgi:hypothetical protein
MSCEAMIMPGREEKGKNVNISHLNIIKLKIKA